PVVHYAAQRLALVDSRTQAVRWLAAHSRSQDRTLFLRELTFLPTQLDTLPGECREAGWPRFRRQLGDDRVRYVVMGYLVLPGPREIPKFIWEQEVWPRYELRASFGSEWTPDSGAVFRGNRQIVMVLERRKGS